MAQSSNLQTIIDKCKGDDSDSASKEEKKIKSDLTKHKKNIDKDIANLIYNTDKLFDAYHKLVVEADID